MPVLNFRTDERSERAFAELMADGSIASDAIRQALVDAVRLRRREQMRIESLTLMNDRAEPESRKVLVGWRASCVVISIGSEAPRGARGSEQQGSRYAVIVQSDDLMLSTVLVAPTSRSAPPRSFGRRSGQR